MLDGIWTAEFSTSRGGSGLGIVVVEGEKVRGGDSSYLFLGSITAGPGAAVTAQIEVRLHTLHPGASNALGASRVSLMMSGTLHEDQISLQGAVKSAQVTVRLRRVAEL